jgi:adenylate cyclase
VDDRTQITHRFAVVMCADVVGYSRLMGIDEEGTLASLNAIRRDLVDPRISAHQGRIVRTMGDGLLVEFGSVTNAVQCALDIQHGMRSHLPALPDDRRIRLRIGINLGDVVSDGDMIYGDGVTVAAHLESMADPGGITVSRGVRDQVRDRLPIAFVDRGEHEIGDIARPVRVFGVVLDGVTANAPPRRRASARVERPSLIVLPFENLGGGGEAEHFLDSVAEDLITELARARWFSVMARNTSFTYKGRTIDPREVAREAGVRYVVEGSLRKAGNRVRIGCRLVSGESGEQLWADRLDGTFEDSFDLQDRLIERVIGSVEPVLRVTEVARACKKPEAERDVYELTRSALVAAFAETPPDNAEALRLLAKALDVDEGYPTANALAAWCHQQRHLMEWCEATQTDRQEAQRLARTAIARGPDVPLALAVGGAVCAMLTRDHDAALAAVDRATMLNPNAAIVLAFDALTRAVCGDYAKAIAHADKALGLSPFEPLGYHAALAGAFAHLLTGHPEQALPLAHKAVEGNRNFAFSFVVLALACARLERAPEAAAAVAQLVRLAPRFHLARLRRIRFADGERLQADLELLRAAHLPE